jgi:hypothetical protein
MSTFAMKFSLGNIAGNYKLKLPQGSPLSSQRKSVGLYISETPVISKETQAFNASFIACQVSLWPGGTLNPIKSSFFS